MKPDEDLTNSPEMRIRFGHNTARVIAILSICFQVMLPSAMAVAQSNGINIASYLCTPSGNAPSAEAVQAISEAMYVLGEDMSDDAPLGEHCSLCTLSLGTDLPNPEQVATFVFYASASIYLPYQIGLAHLAQGPPRHSRGPPKLT